MREIDVATWPRRAQYELFSACAVPQYSVTFQIDVTGVKRFAHEHGVSSYLAMVYLVVQTMGEIENFRYRVRDGRVVEVDSLAASFTFLKPASDLFHITVVRMGDDMVEFCRRAREFTMAQSDFIGFEEQFVADEMVYLSSLPWLEMTGLKGESSNNPDDAIPRVTWGKYTEHDGRLRTNISVEVNHRFVDGLHVGRFAERLQQKIDAL